MKRITIILALAFGMLLTSVAVAGSSALTAASYESAIPKVCYVSGTGGKGLVPVSVNGGRVRGGAVAC